MGRRAAVALVTGAVLVVGGVGAGLALDHADRSAGPDRLTLTPKEPTTVLEPCIPTGDLATVDQLNAFVTRTRGSVAFAGGDVGASVRLQDGRGMFVFGDTLRGPDFDGQQFVRNSMLLFSPGCGRVVLPRDRGAVVPDRPDGVGYWPMSIASVPRDGYDLVGVSVQRVRSTKGSGVFDFEILGPAVALFRVLPGQAPDLVSLRDVGPDTVDPSRPMWGAATAIDDGWVYVYGTSRDRAAVSTGFDLRVARSRPETVGDPTAWEFWDGRAWTPDEARARVLIPRRGGVSQTLSVFHDGDRWYAVSKRDEVLGRDLVVWQAPGPTGPFVAAPPVAEIPSDAVSGTLRYLPLAHPDLLPEPGTVVVSYSENNTDFTVVRDDPRRYRPRFLRVRLPQ
ncbi:DUF4185 domain-containing protein [Pimelobacter simplex]|uniref:DUF4185 domain-containing protein n=1 Tax=Nocardioides simplex TaxID=2045 RepID=UPI0008EAC0EC|nr:DUF4185 domain-containing protein [Pimelobacter simplex]MCG8150767.1 DUF4185 domain-containing protein [Pimelobacter simplex]GEB15287.1 hypothetical protein NSI01_36020 [Pimelobacter simplex]SFM84081.1 protein of unknown function [Pimelobacter simplex]